MGWRPRNTVRLRLTLMYGTLVLISGLALLSATYVLVQQSVGNHGRQSVGVVTGPIVVAQPPSGLGTPLPGTVTTTPGPPPPEVVDELNRKVNELVEAESDRVLKKLLISSAIALGGMLAVSIAVGWFVAGRVLRPLRTVTASVQDITHQDLHRRLNATGPRDEIKELSDTFDELLDRLEGSFEAQRRFVANASHELRTPLARQRVIAQVALADPDPSVEDLTQAHHRILASGEEQARILDALLVLARGQLRPESLEDCDLADIVNEALDRRPVDGLTVTCDLTPTSIRANADLIGRLVVNLIDNAANYNVPDGRIEITTSGGAERPTLTVTNTGPTIPPEQVDGLLEPFRRLGTDRTHHGEGLGLGLSIVSAIAETHDAELALRPGPEGGLTVTVTFPGSASRS